MNESPNDDAGEVPVTPQLAEFQPAMFVDNGRLFVSEGASLPRDVCICCREPATKVIKNALRNPKNPKTWFGKTHQVEAGLCKKHLENHYIALALTFALLAVGVVFLVAGIYSLSIATIMFGLLAILCCGVFRARIPIWSPDPTQEPVEIAGIGKPFLTCFPEYKVEKPE